ncbi:hypothetical protein FQN51_009004 [Onygenales sp. PD_10]|nr:hypothetical protein FQN51_009004 [Onygenales sp. PD_10]
MAESQAANIPEHRLRWQGLVLYKQDLDAQIDGGLNNYRRAKSSRYYAMEFPYIKRNFIRAFVEGVGHSYEHVFREPEE